MLILLFTAFIWGLLIALPCAVVVLTAIALLACWHLAVPPEVGDEPGVPDWWAEFEREFTAYTSREWTAARSSELQV